MKKLFFAFLLFPLNTFAQTFIDVDKNFPHYEAIEWAAEEGIIQGFPIDGSLSEVEMRPNQEVTRAEFLKLVVESHNDFNSSHFDDQFEKEDLENCFLDVDTQWFSSYICAAKEYEFINGYKDGNFYPYKSINYAESAKIISEIFNIDYLEGEEWFSGYLESFEKREIAPSPIPKANKNITRGEMVRFMYSIKKENKVQSCPVPTMAPLPEGCSWNNTGRVWNDLSGEFACIINQYEKVCAEENQCENFLDIRAYQSLNGKVYIYNCEKEVVGADVTSFHYFSYGFGVNSEGILGIDKEHVYLEEKILPNISPNGLDHIGNKYLKNKELAFYLGDDLVFLEDVDLETLTVEDMQVYSEYAFDINYIYYKGQKIERSNGGSFQHLGHANGMEYAKDKNNYYRNGSIIQKSEVPPELLEE